MNTLFGANSIDAAYLLHILTGLTLLCRRLRFCRPLPWVATATAYGVALWIFALYAMAHLAVGNKPFLGFTGITRVALWGHVIYTLVAAAIIEARGVVFDLPERTRPAHG